MRLLVVGLDPAVLDPASASAERQRSYYAGYDVDIVVLAPGNAAETLLSPSIRVYRPGGSGASLLLNAFRLLRRLRATRGKADLATVQEPVRCGTLVIFSGAAKRLHVQDHSAMFARPHRGLKSWIIDRIAQHITRRADRVRTVSLRGKKGMEGIGVSESMIDIVPVATDTSEFRNVSHVPSDHTRLLTIARLFHEKGIDVLLRAFVSILEKKTDARLTIVGDGPEKESLIRHATELKISGSVEFVGTKSSEEIRELLAKTDIYVQPSRFEGWGIAVVEAAAARVPIVMTDVGLAGEVIVDGVSGRVVSPEKPDQLARAIITAIDQRDASRRLAEAASRTVEALPSMEAAVANVRTSLESVAQTEPQPRLWPIVALAFGVRVALLLVTLLTKGEAGLIFGDGLQYMELAQSLLAGKGFLIGGEPFFFRTVGYPLLLAGGLAVFRSVTGFILFQIVLASFLPVLTYQLGKKLRLGTRASWIAALLVALEPHIVFYSILVLTEIVFTFLLLLSFLWTFRAMETKRAADSIRAGIAFGLGMIVKPLFQMFPFVLFVFFLPWIRKIHWRTALKHVAIICAVAFAFMIPWMVRNTVTFGKFAISSQGSAAALYYLGTSIVSVRDQIPYGEAEKRVHEEFVKTYGEGLTKTEEERGFKTEAKKLVLAHPDILARILAVSTVTLWTSSNYNAFLRYYEVIPKPDHSNILPPTHYLAQGRMDEFFGSFWQIFGQPFYAVGIFGRLVWLVITLLCLFGLVSAFIRIPERRFEWVFLVATAAYFTAVIWVDGLGIEARLRFMMMPIEFLYAAYGFVVLREKRRVDPSERRLLVITQRVDQNDTNLAVHVRWLKELATRHKTVTVIAQSVGTHDLPSNVRVRSLGKESGASKFRQFIRLKRHLLREASRTDALLVLMVPMYVILAAPYMFFARVPMYLWYTHKHVSLTLRVAMRFVRKVFSASPESFRLKTKKVRFLGHAIDTEFFSPDSSVVREKGKIITVGRIAAVKRIELIMDAVKNLRAEGQDVRLEIIGTAILDADKTYEARLKETAGEYVNFVGGKASHEVRDAYRSAAVCVNASETGSLDKALLEAMACGCPVVTSNEAFAKIVSPSAFVHSGDASAFAGAIRSQMNSSTTEAREIVLRDHRLTNTLSRLMGEL